MEYSDFTGIVKGELGEQFSNVTATISDRETYDEKIEKDNDGKLVAIEWKTKTFKNPRFHICIDDTSKPQVDGYYPMVGMMFRNPKITERNAKNISTRCENAFRKYFDNS